MIHNIASASYMCVCRSTEYMGLTLNTLRALHWKSRMMWSHREKMRWERCACYTSFRLLDLSGKRLKFPRHTNTWTQTANILQFHTPCIGVFTCQKSFKHIDSVSEVSLPASIHQRWISTGFEQKRGVRRNRLL